MNDATRNLPFISKVQPSKTKVKTGEEITLTISGNWPTPSWELVDVKIETDDKAKTITVFYVGKNKPGLAMQVLKPFSDNVALKIENVGRWQILVQGKSALHKLEIKCIE